MAVIARVVRAACVAWLLAVAPGTMAALAQETPAPPLNISADNVTGSHAPEGDVVLLNGHVRITRGRTVITAQRGRYLRGQGMLYLDDEVKLVDSTTTIECDHASYSEESDVLHVDGNVVLTDKETVVRSPQGTYDRRMGRAELFGGVDARDGRQRITSQRLTYVRDTELVQARGGVRAKDEENRLELRGESVDYDRRSHEAHAVDNPVLESRDEDGTATLMRALTLKLNTESRVAEAVDSVHIVRDTLQARADYALFDDRANRGWLLGHPRAWDEQTTVSGDTLEIWTEKRELRRFVVRRNATMDYRGVRPTNLGETSRLTGDRVDVWFTKEDIDSLVAVGNARNEYRAMPREKKTQESNLAEGDTITVFFRERKIDRAVVRGKATGEYRFAVDVGDTTAAKTELVKYDGRRIEYIVPKERIVLDPAAHLVYKDLELRARRVEFDIDKQTLVAEGTPQLVDRGDKVTGHLMTYDLESQVGTIYQATTAYEKGLYRGEQIRKVGDDVLDVKSGSYSTCSLDHPHYHFQSKWMKIYLKDKLVAKPVVFYVKNVPLLALPFYVFPIKPGRHSGFLFPQFEFGLNNRAGQFLRNAGYYWAPNDYMDITFSGDYYQADPSYVLRAEGVYKLLYVLDGRFIGTFARDEAQRRDNYDFYGDHAQEISHRTRMVARASFVSSRDYQKSTQFGTPLSRRLNRFLTSGFTVTHNADWASFNAVVDRRQDLDADESIKDPDGFGPLAGPPPGTRAALANLTESVPNLSIGFPTRTIGSLGILKDTGLDRMLQSLYATLNARYVSEHTRRAFVSGYATVPVDSVTTDSTTTIAQDDVTRRGAAGNAELRDSRRLFGWINFSTALSGDGVVYDRDNFGNSFVPAGVWRASVGTGTTLYGTALPRLGPLLGVRHVVTPSVGLSYSPEFSSLQSVDSGGVIVERFPRFGGIGVSGTKVSAMTFSLDQRFQVKLQRGEQVTRLDNLLSWSTSGSYNFLWREQGRTHGLSPLVSGVRLSPPTIVSADANWITDPYSPKPIRSFGYNVNTSFRGRRPTRQSGGVNAELPLDRAAGPDQIDFTEPWTVSLAYSYSGGRTTTGWSSQENANAVARFSLTPSWVLDYSTSFDITRHQVLTQRFTLTRDLHCWVASFTRTFNPGGEAEYYFRLGIKDQSEIYVERGTRVGSIGGIQ